MPEQNTTTTAVGSLEGEAGVGVTSVDTVSTDMPPFFGENQNTRFTFQHPWSPPPNFSSERAFPQTPPLAAGNQTNAAQTQFAGSTRLAVRFPARRQNALPQKKRRRESEEENVNDNHDAIIRAQHNSHGTSTTGQQSFAISIQLTCPDLQSILRGTPIFLQICFGFCWKALLLYIVVRIIMVLQQDIVERISESSLEINQEIAICALHYKDNLCATNQVPAMIRQCSEWESCMNRSPAVVGRVKVGAKLIAEVLNSFAEPISWKTLAVVAVFMIVDSSPALRGRYKKRQQIPSHQSTEL